MAEVVLGTFKNNDFACDVSDCAVSEGSAVTTVTKVTFDDDVLKGISIKSPPTSIKNYVRKSWSPLAYGRTGSGCTPYTAEQFAQVVQSEAAGLTACSGNSNATFTTGTCSLTVSGSVTVVYREPGSIFGGKTNCGNSGSITKTFSYHAPYLTGPQSVTLQKTSMNMELVDGDGNRTSTAQPIGRDLPMPPNCYDGSTQYAYKMEACHVCGIPFGNGSGPGSATLCKGTGNEQNVFSDTAHSTGTAIDNGYPTAGLAGAAMAAVAGQAVAAFGAARANAIKAYKAALAEMPDPNCGRISVAVNCTASVGCF